MRGDIWGLLPKQTFERFLNEGWTSPEAILEQCLYGQRRVVTPAMIVNRPQVYSCSRCGRRALTPMKNCLSVAEPLSVASKDAVLFVDSDLVVHYPPLNSSVWSRLGLHVPSSQLPSQQPEQEQAQEPPQSAESSPSPPHAEES